jgi:hypothetical protein
MIDRKNKELKKPRHNKTLLSRREKPEEWAQSDTIAKKHATSLHEVV